METTKIVWQSDVRNSILPYAFGNELEWIRKFVKTLPEDSNIVMIGAGPGVMAMAVLEGLKEFNNFLIIDNVTCGYAQKHINEAKLMSTNINFVVADSTECKYNGPQIDFIIVDGNHSRQGVIADIKNWFKHIKNKGKIFFHGVVDLELNGTNGVENAITESIEEGYMQVKFFDACGTAKVYEKWQ